MTAILRRDFVGQRVRQLRRDRGMTQSELAVRIGVMQSDLCRMEKGEYRVGLDTLFRILPVFGLQIGQFFDEAVAAPSPEDAGDLLAAFRRLTPEGRREVLEYLRFKEHQAGRPVASGAETG